MKRVVAVGLAAVLGVIALGGCAPIQTQAISTQPMGKVLIASTGSVIFRINKTSDLPNVFGKADIYGGKIDRGFTEVRIVSVNSPSEFTLEITDVEKASNETVMERYQPYILEGLKASGNERGTTVNVNTTVNGSQKESTAPGNRISIDFSQTKVFAVSGYLIRFLSFDGVNITYLVEAQ